MNMFQNGMGMNDIGMGGMIGMPMNMQNMGMMGMGGMGGMNGMGGMGGMNGMNGMGGMGGIAGMGGMGGIGGMGGMNIPNGQMGGIIMDHNMNINIQRMNSGGNQNWVQDYSTNEIGNNQIQSQGNKINCVFITSTGKKFTILIDPNKTIKDLIKIFFIRVENPDLINRRQDICFLYNATRLNFDSNQTVENFFKFNSNPRIMVNDTGNLIGA